MPTGEILRAMIDYANLSPNAKIIKSEGGKINGFPSYKVVYSSTASPDEYEFYTTEIAILAHDREYRLTYEAADQNEFDTYRTAVEVWLKQ